MDRLIKRKTWVYWLGREMNEQISNMTLFQTLVLENELLMRTDVSVEIYLAYIYFGFIPLVQQTLLRDRQI